MQTQERERIKERKEEKRGHQQVGSLIAAISVKEGVEVKEGRGGSNKSVLVVHVGLSSASPFV